MTHNSLNVRYNMLFYILCSNTIKAFYLCMYLFILWILIRVTKHSNGRSTTVVARGGDTALRRREIEMRDSTTASKEVFFLCTICMHVCMHSSMCAELTEKAQFHHAYIQLQKELLNLMSPIHWMRSSIQRPSSSISLLLFSSWAYSNRRIRPRRSTSPTGLFSMVIGKSDT